MTVVAFYSHIEDERVSKGTAGWAGSVYQLMLYVGCLPVIRSNSKPYLLGYTERILPQHL